MPSEDKVELTVRVSPQAYAALANWAHECGGAQPIERYLEDAAEALAVPEIFASMRATRAAVLEGAQMQGPPAAVGKAQA